MLRASKTGESCLCCVSVCKDILQGSEQTWKPWGRKHPYWFSSTVLCSLSDLCMQLCIVLATEQLRFIFFDGCNRAYRCSSWPDVGEVRLAACLWLLLLLFPDTSQAPRQLLPTVLLPASAVTGLMLSHAIQTGEICCSLLHITTPSFLS